MAHFAKIENGIVTEVIVVGNEYEETFAESRIPFDEKWVQTSYNTRAGEHLQGGTPLRGNFAGIGYIYDEVADIFYHPYSKNCLPGWIWSDEKASCVPPFPMPTQENKWAWDAAKQEWVLFEDFFMNNPT
jgi:hypothetical protein